MSSLMVLPVESLSCLLAFRSACFSFSKGDLIALFALVPLRLFDCSI